MFGGSPCPVGVPSDTVARSAEKIKHKKKERPRGTKNQKKNTMAQPGEGAKKYRDTRRGVLETPSLTQ